MILLTVGLVLACGVGYIYSLDLAAEFPPVAYLRLPLYVSIAVGLAPLLIVVHAAWRLLALVDRGEAFSPAAVAELGRIRTCFALMSAYLLVGFIVVENSPLQNPAAGVLWLGGQVGLAIMFVLTSLLQRRARDAGRHGASVEGTPPELAATQT